MTQLFAVTAALSACLLFLVQPLIAKPILPLLGGSPSVWITCMVMFQLLLLAGYVYAYASSRCLSLRRQGMLHLLLFGASLLLLPFGLRTAGFEPVTQPKAWLAVTLLLSVGGPYLLLASSSPMLQRWAANTTHPLARNPYPLYAASNAGSFVGLLSYPLLIEPRFDTPHQFGILTTGYVLLALGFVACAILMWRHTRTHAMDAPAQRRAPVGMASLWRWLCYSAIPASTLFGTTTYIVSDIASVPLLWIIPLMLYLASFIFAFSERGWRARGLLVAYVPLALVTLFCVLFTALSGRLGITPALVVVLGLSTLFTGALLFHRRLYELRPLGEDSGLFYVLLALGGAIGGCFNTFVAPQIFHSAAEYPLVLALGPLLVLLPDFLALDVRRGMRFPKEIACLLLLLAMGAGYCAAAHDHLLAGAQLWAGGAWLLLLVFSMLLVFDWLYQTRARVLAATLSALLMGGYVAAQGGGSWLYTERNFFGISRVREDTELALRVYAHGVTLHGLQSTDEKYRLVPGAYYGPLRDIFARLPAAVMDAPVGALGLGIGTIACYAKPRQEMDFYEIDPASIHIANDPTYFTFMRDCPGRRRIIVGDGRIELTKAPDGRYGLIVMDAFSSDAIPMHLLTLEALTMYGRKLRPDGLIAFNVSNRYLDLLPVLRTLSAELGWPARYRFNAAVNSSREVSSLWVVLAKNHETLEPLDSLRVWKPLPAETGSRYRWTDDYSNLLGILRFSSDWTSQL